jgi:protein-disulfide isomerase/predicted methyltransferase
MDSSEMNVDRWADDCLASLDPPSDWRPNAGQALGQLRARGQARRIGRGPLLWAAAAVAVAVGVGLLILRTPDAPILVGQVGNLRRIGNPPAAGAGTPAVHPPPPAQVARSRAPKPALQPTLAPQAATHFKESGSPTAPITVEIYLDYECPPCAAFYREMVPPLIAQYVRTGSVRLLHRDFPLPRHRYAAVAARYTNAAGRAGYYEAAVDQIFKTMAVWSRDGNIDEQLAQVLPSGVMEKVRGLVDHDPELDATVTDDVAMARRDQINRRPALVIVSKGERTVLAPIDSFDTLKTQLDQLLAAQLAWQQLSAAAGSPTTLEDFKAIDATREAWDRRASEILKALEATAGDWVADVGAGAGYYAMHLSGLVGTGGKVFAEDISDTSVVWLGRRVKLFQLPNVEVVKGAADDPKLPAASLAAVLVVNTYHHFTDHQAMAAQMLRALKPGGRLVIVDYSLRAHRTESRAEQLKRHEIDPDLVRVELGLAGFQVLKTEDPFLQRMPDVKNGGGIANADMWLMTAVRPK